MRSGPGEGGGPGDFLAHPTCYIQMGRDRRDREPWPGVNCLNGPRVASKKNWATCSWEKNQGRERLISFFSRVLTSKRRGKMVLFGFLLESLEHNFEEKISHAWSIK